MEQLGPLANGFANWLGAVTQPLLKAAIATSAAPVAAPAAAPLPIASIGLKVLLEPQTGGVIFRAACNTVATLYPVYASAKAIESKDSKDDVQWLTYWTLYGSLILAEHLMDQALGKVPFYYHAKFAALLWLQLPQTRGASYLYNRYYKPALIKYGPRIDTLLARGQTLLANLYTMYKVPIDALLALLEQLRKQAVAGVAYLLAEDKKAEGGKEGQGSTKAHAA